MNIKFLPFSIGTYLKIVSFSSPLQFDMIRAKIITIIQVALAMHELLTTQDLLALCLFDTRLGSFPGRASIHPTFLHQGNRAGDNLLMYHLREVQGGQPHQLLRWKRLFRVSVGVYRRLCRDLENILRLSPRAHGASARAIQPQETVAIGLHVLGSPGYLHSGGTEMGWSYQSMKKHTMRFARAVVRVYGDTLFEFPETVGQLQTACDLMMLEREVPNCLGAMDGKIFFMNFGADDNVALKSYKGGRGVNVLALVSADYRFRWHSAFVGGNDVDASLWNKSSLKQRIARLEWPPEDSRQAINEPQEESLAMRPIILVDGTFAGSPVLQKPYPVAQLDLPSKLLFNKIHDSGRKVVEQAFGQVVGRFGIFAQPVRWLAESTPEDLADVIKCAFILHNLCINMHDVFDGDDDDGGGGEQRDWGLDENIETTRMVMTEYRTYFTVGLS
eukprot:g63054.t1